MDAATSAGRPTRLVMFPPAEGAVSTDDHVYGVETDAEMTRMQVRVRATNVRNLETFGGTHSWT
jgi:hypothetical protein